MLDGKARKLIDPTLMQMSAFLVKNNITPNQVTIAGFVIGILAAVAIGFHYFWLGLLLLLISRLADGLDGSVAKLTKSSDFGGFLDITLDFAFYGMIPVAFIFANPGENALAGSVLILSFYVNGASFLAYSIMAEKNKMKTEERGKKSLYFTTGLAEATETILVFVAFCLFPNWFSPIAWLFAFICFYTAFARIMLAKQTLVD